MREEIFIQRAHDDAYIFQLRLGEVYRNDDGDASFYRACYVLMRLNNPRESVVTLDYGAQLFLLFFVYVL